MNFTTFFAAILIVSPVRGFLPSRADLLDTDQEPNPTKETRPPPLSDFPTFPKKDSNDFFAAAF